MVGCPAPVHRIVETLWCVSDSRCTYLCGGMWNGMVREGSTRRAAARKYWAESGPRERVHPNQRHPWPIFIAEAEKGNARKCQTECRMTRSRGSTRDLPAERRQVGNHAINLPAVRQGQTQIKCSRCVFCLGPRGPRVQIRDIVPTRWLKNRDRGKISKRLRSSWAQSTPKVRGVLVERRQFAHSDTHLVEPLRRLSR